ncbi:tRNA(Met) cytidine acetyltransferase TmcA [Kosakonia sp. MUSA4]|uniref:tRNA(Met) cytidine acetyltransferase TmcA n=1 Tax=Kosakonia sp. MUSA4 TaxID=2067958 RepID=UPI00159928F6|nr:GNAT family N-acetyltransferase [Kosakonia sp. MUSA4]QJT81904.1 tRNA cytosine(34) acetyltransferase TmcA [Kosakonia sp. MUSA4]
MSPFSELSAQMARQGIRRLLVVSGSPGWCEAQACTLRENLPGDWLWVGEAASWPLHCAPRALTTLLGREFQHAVFDARTGFDVAAFAALAGTLTAGSWLVLLTPPFSVWPQQPDADSARWSDTLDPIPVPVFVGHFCRTVQADSQVLIWREGQPLTFPAEIPRADWHPATGAPAQEQARILARLQAMPPGVMVVTAPRGRGKSALAGMHIARLSAPATVTAPARAATDVLAAYAGEHFSFIAPDALAQRIAHSGNQPGWLVVDEAAAIPGPLLHTLVSAFRHVLLTTTVQGYEGTGQGFLLKFCAGFPHLQFEALNTPLRWAAGCPLEQVIENLLLFDDAQIGEAPAGEVTILPLAQDAWQKTPSRPAALYRLLASAHYRTSPLDLRRMMDAPGQHFWLAQKAQSVVAALWLVEEGGLSPALSQAVWAGFRRPRGNLVAQSLAAHGGNPLAAMLRGLRVSRIAVHPGCQREGIGRALITRAQVQADGCDYLSVSFGFTPALWRFWQRCGFVLVRLGSHREASSGCYTAMAILPLTTSGQALAEREQQRLARDLPWLAPWREEKLSLPVVQASTLNEEDWQELAGFAFAHRPLSAAIGALSRLLQHSALPLAALRGQLSDGESEQAVCQRLSLHGRKALLAQQRSEAAQALQQLNAWRTLTLKERVQKMQFF